jgi:hypothetical protein
LLKPRKAKDSSRKHKKHKSVDEDFEQKLDNSVQNGITSCASFHLILILSDTPDVPSKKSKKRKRDTQDITLIDNDTKEKRKKRKSSEVNALEPAPEVSSAPPSHLPSSPPSPSDTEAFLSKHSITIHASRSGGTVIPILSFDQLDVSIDLKQAFAGFKEPTPIQACSWPPALNGQDVVGIAETGRLVAYLVLSSFKFSVQSVVARLWHLGFPPCRSSYPPVEVKNPKIQEFRYL